MNLFVEYAVRRIQCYVQSAHCAVQAPERLSIRQCAFYCEQNKSLFNARCLIEYRVNRLVNKCKATVHSAMPIAQLLQHQMTMYYFTKKLFLFTFYPEINAYILSNMFVHFLILAFKQCKQNKTENRKS